MSLRCPVCKADNVERPACRRCKADLATLFALEDCRTAALATGRRCLAEGKSLRAAERFLVAQRQRDGRDVLQNLALAALLHRDFASALRLWRRASD